MPNAAITGAGSGLGRALALEYAKNGYKIFLLGRTVQKLHMVQEEILQSGGQAEVVLCDIREQASVGIAFQQIGELDLLINNAGIGRFGPIEDYTNEDIEQTFNTNVKGSIYAVQSALPLIKATNGRILMIISTAGLRGKVHESVYAASKFAVRGFAESLQEEWKDKDYSITSVYMGGMNTPFWKESTHVEDASHLKGPEGVAQHIFQEDDGRREIIIDQ
ncbi:3-hydroxybutyrate dehydrogenase [Lentibacillus sp. JNUCC-1]|uniref:SDR family NAD(P)-dependent oxidoreductase n=1 Tax=Lentibacillus sp. JNUCC-1 TaxID=2654513 RepID=UPI0012E89FB9|nr:SDR family oxidoreductase [Lentibacillus sp. JNUCC-1]MUV38708.1 3-hydroxybutyrate dehydrogenase [Lentibacillus sp. JNUCC-1]